MKKDRFVKVDSHAHITSNELYNDVDQIILRAKEAGVSKIVNICTDVVTFERGLEIKKRYPAEIFNTVATTPHDVEKEGEENFLYFEKAILSKQVVAVGEVGLDYYYEHSKKDVQKEFLKRYFQLALKANLPVVIHCRGDDAFLDLLKFPQDIKAVLHCFTGNLYHAKACLERGWYISLSGILTFKKSIDLQNLVKDLPLSKLLIETDSPYLAPQSKRGKVNEPANVCEIADMIAFLQGVSLEEVLFHTTKNALDFFVI
ncbi:MAG: TatD family deoxyribonuclease [Chlamydiae bacterium]|nr:TatD family deoxyribonuclease [Chlamydiota bacterium]